MTTNNVIARMAKQLEERRAKRDLEIARLAKLGQSNAEIARRVGVSRQRVQQIRARAEANAR